MWAGAVPNGQCAAARLSPGLLTQPKHCLPLNSLGRKGDIRPNFALGDGSEKLEQWYWSHDPFLCDLDIGFAHLCWHPCHRETSGSVSPQKNKKQIPLSVSALRRAAFKKLCVRKEKIIKWSLPLVLATEFSPEPFSLCALHLPLLLLVLAGVHLLHPVHCSSGNLTSFSSQLEMCLSCRLLDGDAFVCFPVWEEGMNLLNFAPVP